MLPIITGIFTGAASLWTNYQQNKAKAQKRKDDISDAVTLQELQNIKTNNNRAGDLDRIYAKGSKVMQRVSFGAAMIPIFMCFIPGGAPYVERAFIALEGLPNWYLVGLGGMLISIWGFRGMLVAFLRWRCALKQLH